MAAQEMESQFSGQDVSRDSPLKEDGRDARLPLSTRGYQVRWLTAWVLAAARPGL